MEKFHFNPFPLTKETRDFFPHLKTLFVYNKDDELFENDERIIARKIQTTPYYLTGQQKKQIEEWCGLGCGEIIFDSGNDNWSVNRSVFDERIKGKKQLLFIIEDDHYEKFGYYLNTEVKNEYRNINDDFIPTDSKSFEFNIESNGILKSMMKFPIKDTKDCGYKLFDK